MLLLVNNVHDRNNITESQERDRRNSESVRALFVICTCVTTLHSCSVRMRWLSADQKRACNFFVYIITNVSESRSLSEGKLMFSTKHRDSA